METEYIEVYINLKNLGGIFYCEKLDPKMENFLLQCQDKSFFNKEEKNTLMNWMKETNNFIDTNDLKLPFVVKENYYVLQK
jgi:hypothetical protein